MANFYLNDREQDALTGLPHLYQLLYQAIKRRMDFSTGIAGQRFRISYQSLSEAVEVEPKPGRRDHGKPTRRQIERAVEELCRSSEQRPALLQAHGNLVFTCLLADTDSSVSEKVVTKWGGSGEGQVVDKPRPGKPNKNGALGEVDEAQVVRKWGGSGEGQVVTPPTPYSLKEVPKGTSYMCGSSTPNVETTPKAKSQKKAIPQEVLEAFETAWAVYPKRGGANNRKGALEQFAKRVAEGVKPEELIDGTKRYRVLCDATGNTGTEYVKMAVTFYGPKEHYMDSYELPTARPRQTPHTGQTTSRFGKASDWKPGSAARFFGAASSDQTNVIEGETV